MSQTAAAFRQSAIPSLRCYLDAVEERGRFTISVTGGKALDLLARAITKEPYLSFVDWRKWFVFILEERCVPLTSPCSSYRSQNPF